MENDFLTTFNEFYPFERYILKTPQVITDTFDDIELTEIFIPSTEIETNYIDKIHEDIFVKLRCKGVEFRMAFFDFDYDVRNDIIGIVKNDFGNYEWQSLFCDYDNEESYDDLQELLFEQIELIKNKYGVCNIKKHFIDKTIIGLLSQND